MDRNRHGFAIIGTYIAFEMWGEMEDIANLNDFMTRLPDSLDLVDLPDAVHAIYKRTPDFMYRG